MRDFEASAKSEMRTTLFCVIMQRAGVISYRILGKNVDLDP